MIEFKIACALDEILRFVDGDDEDFHTIRRKLSDLLVKTHDQRAQEAVSSAIARVERSRDAFTKDEAALILGDLEMALGEPLIAAIEAPIYSLTEALYSAGLLDAGKKAGVNLNLMIPDQDALRALGRQNYFWVGDHWGSELQPRFKQHLEAYFKEGISRSKLADRIEREFADIVIADRQYWENMANHMSTKIRELGRIQGYKRAGIKEVRVRSRLAHNTCEFCVDMNGRIISVDHLEAQYEQITSAHNVDALKAAQPWRGQALNKPTDSLGIDVGSPPYHWKCYCMTEAFFRELEEPVNLEFAGDVSKEDRAILKTLSPWEYSNKLKDAQKIGGVGTHAVAKVARAGRTGRARGVNFEFFPTRSAAKKAAKKGALAKLPKVDGRTPSFRLDAKPLNMSSDKFVKYALNPDHPTGKHKARVFQSALGYNQSNWRGLTKQLREKVPKTDLRKVTQKILSPNQNNFRYTSVVPIKGPNGKTADVVTGWIYDGKSYRMTTVYVD